jgi:ATP-dependent DNA helicase PIF1
MELSYEQQQAYNKYINGHNVFITGPAGTGKSALIKLIYGHANLYEKDIYVTALTGCASLLLECNAKTLHSWAGLYKDNITIEEMVVEICKRGYLKRRWQTTDVLIVDEVSMLSLRFFECLDKIARAIRKNSKPFGGIQVIFSGDFYQLPPVTPNKTTNYCFESEVWNEVFKLENQIELINIFRQKDVIYSSILNEIREGIVKRKTVNLLMKYVDREKKENSIIEPTKLFPKKEKVNQINYSKMAELNTQIHIFKMQRVTDYEMTKEDIKVRNNYTKKEIETELDYISGNLMCEKEIHLKVGAQVMSIKNIINERNELIICNGSQGIIVDFCPTKGYPIVLFNNGVKRTMVSNAWRSEKIPGIGISQVPVILAWALTIHKSQGTTLDIAEMDIGNDIFELGQSYVALSRVKSLDGLYLTNFDPKKIQVSSKVKEYYRVLRNYHSENIQEIDDIIETPAIAIPLEEETTNISIMPQLLLKDPDNRNTMTPNTMTPSTITPNTMTPNTITNPFIEYQYIDDQYVETIP